MNKQQLRERLVGIIANAKLADVVGFPVDAGRYADQVLALMGSAGWKAPDEDQRLLIANKDIYLKQTEEDGGERES